jgi:amidase
MSTFISKLDPTGDGPRLAVKDIIDVAGVPTTAGSRALERIAAPADADAACLAGARAAGARIVGKTNLHELAALPIGTNAWFGAPVNPLDAALIPGGSSSGSAAAVATDEADVALGSDTGGSVRVPSACCGTAGTRRFVRMPRRTPPRARSRGSHRCHLTTGPADFTTGSSRSIRSRTATAGTRAR